MLRGMAGLGVALALGAAGCGGGGGVPANGPTGVAVESMANSSLDDIKARIKPIAESGVAGASALYGIDEALKKAGKADLVADLDKIMQAQTPEDVKAAAAAFLGKL